jgi:hypothetical protein
MALTAARRVAPSPREELRVAVAERRRIAERQQRLRQAIANAREVSLDKIGAVDAAESALAEAERSEQQRAVALALGEAAPAGPSVAEARAALEQAQRQHQLAREAIATLQAGLTNTALPVSAGGAKVKGAIAGVLESEGAVEGLLEAYDLSRARTAMFAAVLLELGPALVSNPGWQHSDRPVPPFDPALLAAWRSTLQALEAGEADMPLPDPA